MWKKLSILSLCISVLIVFSAPIATVNAGDRSIKANWQVIGTIVEILSGSTTPAPYSLLNLSAQGPPSIAKMTVLSSFDQTNFPDTSECPENYQTQALYFIKNDAVTIFPDQSFLFGSIDETFPGILCIGAAGGYFHVKVNILGGTGRYVGASGNLDAEGYSYPIPPDFILSGENGTIKGTIHLP